MSKISKFSRYIPAWQAIFDVVISVLTLWVVSHYIYHEWPIISHFPRSIFAMVVASLVVMPFAFRTHRRRMMRTETLVARSFFAALCILTIYAAILMFMHSESVRSLYFIILYVALAVMFMITWVGGLFLLRKIRRHGYNLKRVIIIGTRSGARNLAKRLTQHEGYGIVVLGHFSNDLSPNFKGSYLGDLSKVDEFVKANRVKDIYYADSTENDHDIANIIKISDDNMCNFYITPLLSSALKQQFYMIMINDNIPVMGIHPSPLSSPTNRVIKRAFDIVFSSVVLVFSPLVLIPVGIAIKMSSPGPIFFKQKRTGYRGRDFYCYKFRTMKVNKDSDSVQATKDDDRKTRVGNFLRHTSIDELPQFFNVLRGDMSVVGPRPHMLSHTEEYRHLISQYMVRHTVKPGITGWAQVNGYRGATEELWQMENRVDNDVWYIEHWSFLLDLKCIVLTVTNAIKGEENAY